MSHSRLAMFVVCLKLLVPAADAPAEVVPLSSEGRQVDDSSATLPPGPAPAPQLAPLFRPEASKAGAVVVETTPDFWTATEQRAGAIEVVRFPLRRDLTVDLVLERFFVTGEQTRFVIGRRHGEDAPLAFDSSRVVLLRGQVRGDPASHVFLAISESMTSGQITAGSQTYCLSTRGLELEPGRFGVFAKPAGGYVPEVPFCAFDESSDWLVAEPRSDRTVTPGQQHIELAVDSDYDYYELFNDLDAAAAYVVTLYGAVADIFLRDLNARIELTYVRLWDDQDDLFNEYDPLWSFASYWEWYMSDVQRDVAQLLTGRRNLPYGGVAFIGLCSGYSVSGRIRGSFPTPVGPNPGNWDLFVTAHELGHNCGTHHTHCYNPPIDRCHNAEGGCYDDERVFTRGTIMSYCHRGNGSEANLDPRFHARVQDVIQTYLHAVDCVVTDCNGNGVPDDQDVLGGGSPDLNTNGIPDECEDCNTNGVLDGDDIAAGTSADLNGNDLPDECEPDCNSNSIPDELDIELGTSEDFQGDRIPDDCEPDCNGDGYTDYSEIWYSASGDDVNRNTVPDSCEDCDADLTTDREALDSAHNIWVVGQGQNRARQYHAQTGAAVLNSSVGAVHQGLDALVGPDGRLYVSSAADDLVAVYDGRSGVYEGDFVSEGAGGLSYPSGLAFTPGGDLLVASRDTNAVLRFDGSTGTLLGDFVSPGAGGLTAPYGLTVGPWGNLYVGSDGTDQVLEYDGGSGAFVRVLVDTRSGGLLGPRGLTFIADGSLLVAGLDSYAIHKYDGQTGAFVGIFDLELGAYSSDFRPWGLRVGPNGNLFVSVHSDSPRVQEYDPLTGHFIKFLVQGYNAYLDLPTGFDFVPGWEADCNLNNLPDECDIAFGVSEDLDGDGTPDECQIDCNNNGVPDRRDLIPFGQSFDCNGNDVPDECDVISGASGDCNTNGIPDECEVDCNSNGVPDQCDIASGFSPDCQSNGVPDDCEIAAGSAADCNTNSLPDECDIASGWSEDCTGNGTPDECETDCNTNGVADSCDVAFGTSEDCNSNGFPDECELGQLLASFEFDTGLPPSWTASGLWHFTDACQLIAGECASPPWAYYGQDSSCDFDVGYTAGTLSAPVLTLPNVTPLTLTYCSVYVGEGGDSGSSGWDWAWVTANGVEIDDVSADGFHVEWQMRSVDLTPFRGQDVILSWHFDSLDEIGNALLGWQVDTVEITTGLGGLDCNTNGIPDECDIASGSSGDCNGNGRPDECEPDEDCNSNGVQDICDIAAGSDDCNGNSVPDECELTGNDCNSNGLLDECEPDEDCNTNGVQDICDLAAGTSTDCNGNLVPDECELTGNDCNSNGVPDDCELAGGSEVDCNSNGQLDECEPDEDCNTNGVQDICDVATGTSADCNDSDVPDECELDADCNTNLVPDECDISSGSSGDCNGNDVPDECELDPDCNTNGVPDECDLDPADPDGDGQVSTDVNTNGVPDECESGEIVSARSCRAHGGAGHYCVGLGIGDGSRYTGDNLEWRLGRVGRLEFDVTLPPLDFAAEVTCAIDTEYTATVTTVTDGSSTVYVEFEPPLPSNDCCTITFAGGVADVQAVATLECSVDGNLVVDILDFTAVKSRFGQGVDSTNFRYDLNRDGVINSLDSSAIKARFGNSLAGCP